MTALQKLEEIAATSSKLEKVKLIELLKEEDSDFWSYLFETAYRPDINFWIQLIDMPHKHIEDGELSYTLEEGIDWALTQLASRNLTGRAATDSLRIVLMHMAHDDAEVLARVVKRDLRIGASESTINKVWPELIYQHPYMRCESFSAKALTNISLPCLSQVKADGLYVDIVVSNHEVKYMTRNGNILNLNHIDRDNHLTSFNKSFVLQGEALCVDGNGNVLPREESNGLLNSDDFDLSRVVFDVWDVIPYEDFLNKSSPIPYEDRFENLMNTVVMKPHPSLRPIETRYCESVDEIVEHFTDVRNRGLEGLVVKDLKGLWKNGTSKHQVKIKVVIEVELKITGWNEGKGKYAGKVGSIIGQTSDGLLEVGVGTGLKDKDRTELVDRLPNLIQSNAVMTVKCNGVLRNKDGGLHALFLPVYKETRIDKFEADSFEKIVEQEKSFTDMLQLIEG